MSSISPLRSAWMLAAMAALGGFQLYLWPHITDDAYITFRYALNLANGNGLVFNPGEHVEGFSNPLWTILLAALHSLTRADIPDIARVCGLTFAAGTIVAGTWAVRTAESPGGPGAALFILLVILNPGFHVYATAGLEGPLLGFLLVAGLALSLQSSSRSQLAAAAAFGLAGITRPEGPLYALLWFIATLRPPFALRQLVRAEATRCLVMILPMTAWQIFRIAYFGAVLPNTAVAKVPGVFGEFINFPEYITPWVVAAGGPLLFALWFVIPQSRTETARLVERIALALAGANLIFVAYARGDWMTFGRFIAPVWPAVSVAMALWLSAGLSSLKEHPLLRFGKSLNYLPVLGIAACSLLAWHPSIGKYIDNEGMNMLMRGDDQLAVGRWIDRNISTGATVATGRLGGISYGAMENVVWDWFGLTDAEEARFIRRGRPGTLADDPVFRRNPDVIAAIEAPADWSYTRTSRLMDFLHENYIFVLGFPQGRYGYVDIWIRRDRIDEVLVTKDEFVL